MNGTIAIIMNIPATLSYTSNDANSIS